MEDIEFELLKIQAAICPTKEGWPSPDVQVTALGDKPTITGELHWDSLHTCVTDARDRVVQAFAKMSAIDDDKALSREGKGLKKRESVGVNLITSSAAITIIALAGREVVKTLGSASR